MTLTSIADLVRSVRSRSPRWMRNPQVVFRLRMRQKLAHRSAWAGAWDA